MGISTVRVKWRFTFCIASGQVAGSTMMFFEPCCCIVYLSYRFPTFGRLTKTTLLNHDTFWSILKQLITSSSTRKSKIPYAVKLPWKITPAPISIWCSQLFRLETFAGFEFNNAIVGGAVPKEYVPAVVKGTEGELLNGIRMGFPVVVPCLLCRWAVENHGVFNMFSFKYLFHDDFMSTFWNNHDLAI